MIVLTYYCTEKHLVVVIHFLHSTWYTALQVYTGILHYPLWYTALSIIFSCFLCEESIK